MGDEVKKISFGFSKIAKKTSIVSSKLSLPKTDDIKVEFIDCLEGKSIKLKDPVQCEDKLLVIPLKREPKDDSVIHKELAIDSLELTDQQPKVECGNPSLVECRVEGAKVSSADCIPVKNETLDDIAAREIIEELNKKKTQEETRVFSVPLTSNTPIGEKESSLDDYENIPITQFGMAMLRGMGWAPGKGIGKNEKLATPSMPTLRPKGMGLGADKVIKSAIESVKTTGEDLKMVKGSFVRIIAGSHKDCYGQIEGFDDESGRMIVKLTLKNISVSLNEFMVQLVGNNEFIKNSKVINVAKYEKYKDDEDKKEFKKQSNKDDADNKIPSISSERELSEQIMKSSKHYGEKTYKPKSRSNTPEDDNRRRKNDLASPSRHSSNPYSKSGMIRQEFKSSQNLRHGRSSSSDKTSGSSDYSNMKRHRTKKKKPSSHRHKSRTRSRSPRDHSSHKKHKKRK